MIEQSYNLLVNNTELNAFSDKNVNSSLSVRVSKNCILSLPSKIVRRKIKSKSAEKRKTNSTIQGGSLSRKRDIKTPH